MFLHHITAALDCHEAKGDPVETLAGVRGGKDNKTKARESVNANTLGSLNVTDAKIQKTALTEERKNRK